MELERRKRHPVVVGLSGFPKRTFVMSKLQELEIVDPGLQELEGKSVTLVITGMEGKFLIWEFLHFKGRLPGRWEASQGDGASKYCGGI